MATRIMAETSLLAGAIECIDPGDSSAHWKSTLVVRNDDLDHSLRSVPGGIRVFLRALPSTG